ncbi:TIGR03618 family F420-dependent PPOX class oxidoreductase [Agrococcus jejuensis]|uniref:TIGR03618 family F420-dependent PPOX class oxidoreductase n=1 Tax=Agrococcus jejuensis TaxID=399736 RepID=UPI0011A13E66|nr:TIGR03618 family F420-dependent PPOX class oxidoreductase [Agrococcus jejuensis]
MTTLSADALDFLRKPNPAVMATLAKDGRPVAVATWYLLEDDGRILVNLDAERVRLGHLRRDPRFALDVIDETNWYTHLSLQLVVDEIADDPDFAGIDSLSKHYGGRPYPDHERPRVDVRARIVGAHGWGAQQAE